MKRKIQITVSLILIFLSSSYPKAYAGVLGFDDARHLLIRTGFSPQYEQIIEFSKLSREDAVDKLLRETYMTTPISLPDWYYQKETIKKDLHDLRKQSRKNDDNKFREKVKYLQKEYSKSMRVWWYALMLQTPSPFTEKMTLFWHNHFATSGQKVKHPVYMIEQNVLLRKHALGSFREMLHAVAKDPAMLIYLDNRLNRKESPNENFAREVMELFTLGEGHYSEQDIREAARAFTGWGLNHKTSSFHVYPQRHDNEIKTVLGHHGNFDGDDIIEILLEEPQTAIFISEKLWKEFVSPDPDPEEIKRLAAIFRTTNYNIKTLLKAILTSDHFYRSENKMILIKSPIELVAGTLRQFNIQLSNLEAPLKITAHLGQDIFHPPNVKGWPGSEYWINSHTLQLRKHFLEYIFPAQNRSQLKRKQKFNKNKMNMKMDINLDQWTQTLSNTNNKHDHIAKVLISSNYTANIDNLVNEDYVSDFDFIKKVVLSPYYQLK